MIPQRVKLDSWTIYFDPSNPPNRAHDEKTLKSLQEVESFMKGIFAREVRLIQLNHSDFWKREEGIRAFYSKITKHRPPSPHTESKWMTLQMTRTDRH